MATYIKSMTGAVPALDKLFSSFNIWKAPAMVLPQVKSLHECVDYSKVIEPFVPHFYELPYKIWDNIDSLDGLKSAYVTTNPLVSGFALSLVFGLITLIASEINRNYSQVDRLWSILPNVFVVHIAVWARLAGLPHDRVDLIAAFTTIWSVRLNPSSSIWVSHGESRNFLLTWILVSDSTDLQLLEARRLQDWLRGLQMVKTLSLPLCLTRNGSRRTNFFNRMIVKAKLNPIVWFIFNVTFISFFQCILLFLFSGVPTYVVLLSSQLEPGIQLVDLVFFGVEVLLVASEWISDGQQWGMLLISNLVFVKVIPLPLTC